MSRFIPHTAFVVALFLSATNASARDPYVPNIEGRFDTKSTEICTITQNGGSILISAQDVGVTHFLFQGEYGTRTMGNAQCQIQWDGFHGHYRIMYDDNRPSIEGVASVLQTPRNGEWDVQFYTYKNGQLTESYVKSIRRIGPLNGAGSPSRVASRPAYPVAPQPASNRLDVSNNEFDLLPADDLADLGL